MARFDTKIPTHGPNGNIFVILGNALALMQELELPKEDTDALQSKVMGAASYEEACAAVQEWFPLEGMEELREASDG